MSDRTRMYGINIILKLVRFKVLTAVAVSCNVTSCSTVGTRLGGNWASIFVADFSEKKKKKIYAQGAQILAD